MYCVTSFALHCSKPTFNRRGNMHHRCDVSSRGTHLSYVLRAFLLQLNAMVPPYYNCAHTFKIGSFAPWQWSNLCGTGGCSEWVWARQNLFSIKAISYCVRICHDLLLLFVNYFVLYCVIQVSTGSQSSSTVQASASRPTTLISHMIEPKGIVDHVPKEISARGIKYLTSAARGKNHFIPLSNFTISVLYTVFKHH